MISGQNFNPVAITEIFKTQKMCFFVIFNCKPRKIQKAEILFLLIGQWLIYFTIRPRQMKSKIFSPYLLPLQTNINTNRQDVTGTSLSIPPLQTRTIPLNESTRKLLSSCIMFKSIAFIILNILQNLPFLCLRRWLLKVATL